MRRVGWAGKYMCLWGSGRPQESLDRVRYRPDPLGGGESSGESTCPLRSESRPLRSGERQLLRVNGRGSAQHRVWTR